MGAYGKMFLLVCALVGTIVLTSGGVAFAQQNAGNIGITGEFYVEPSDVSQVQSYVYRWGTTSGNYVVEQTVSNPTTLVLPFQQAGLEEGITYFAQLQTNLVAGGFTLSDEIQFTILTPFSNQFCIRGTLNGQNVTLCVPAVIQSTP